MKRDKVATKVWNKLFPPMKGDRVRITECIYPDEEPDLQGKKGVIETICYVGIPGIRMRPFGIRLDSGRLVWVEKGELERIGKS